jgi:hypothetical protein
MEARSLNRLMRVCAHFFLAWTVAFSHPACLGGIIGSRMCCGLLAQPCHLRIANLPPALVMHTINTYDMFHSSILNALQSGRDLGMTIRVADACQVTIRYGYLPSRGETANIAQLAMSNFHTVSTEIMLGCE